MSIYVAPINSGLGDLIVCLPILQTLIANHQSTYLVTRCHLQEGLEGRISGLAGCVSEIDFRPSELALTDRYLNLREHPLQQDFLWDSQEFRDKYGKIKINDIQSEICRDAGIEVDFSRLQPLAYKTHQEARNKVIFLPGSAVSYKSWPSAHWLDLYFRLQACAIDTAIVGRPHESQAVAKLIESGIPWIPTDSLEDALDVLSSCIAVVAVDTGLMHLAVHQGTPTVSLFRNYDLFTRPYSHCKSLVAEPCPEKCATAMQWEVDTCKTQLSGWRPDSNYCRMPESQKCLSEISPQAVLHSLFSIIPSASLISESI